MEIPNCGAWLHKMYDSDKADSWMGLCEAKSRDPRERDMRESFARIAKQDGKFITRKVNDNPQSGKGLEWGWLQSIKQPLDLYWASWFPTAEPKESEADPVGYFMFIDGAFRWDSNIQSFKPSQTKITLAKLVQPKLIKKVDPVYPPDAADRNVIGTVRVYYVIGGDGRVYNAQLFLEKAFQKNRRSEKLREDAVRQWRYLPLTIDGKPAEMDFHADVVFAVKN